MERVRERRRKRKLSSPALWLCWALQRGAAQPCGSRRSFQGTRGRKYTHTHSVRRTTDSDSNHCSTLLIISSFWPTPIPADCSFAHDSCEQLLLTLPHTKAFSPASALRRRSPSPVLPSRQHKDFCSVYSPVFQLPKKVKLSGLSSFTPNMEVLLLPHVAQTRCLPEAHVLGTALATHILIKQTAMLE